MIYAGRESSQGGGGRERGREAERKTHVLDKRAGKVSHEFDYEVRIPGKWPNDPGHGSLWSKGSWRGILVAGDEREQKGVVPILVVREMRVPGSSNQRSHKI